MTYRFTTIIAQKGRWFVARCVELGVVSQGKTVEEAQKNIKEAVELYLEDQPKVKLQSRESNPLITMLEVQHA